MDDLNMLDQTWDLQADSWEGLAVSATNRERGRNLKAHAKLVLDAYKTKMSELRAKPYRDKKDDDDAVKAIRAELTAKLGNVNAFMSALNADVARGRQVPGVKRREVNPQNVLAIQGRLAPMDSVEILGLYMQAAADDDIDVLEAINSAHKVAFPAIGAMFAANPNAKVEAAKMVRYNGHPEQRRAHDDTEILAESAAAIVNDLKRVLGAPDDLQRQASGQ